MPPPAKSLIPPGTRLSPGLLEPAVTPGKLGRRSSAPATHRAAQIIRFGVASVLLSRHAADVPKADIACRATSSCDRLSRIAAGQASQVPSNSVPAGQEPSRRTTQRHPASEPVIPHLDPMPLPKLEHHDASSRTHVDRGRQVHMTASSPRGTFSQAELTVERVIQRVIIRSPASSAQL
jgi:hypothetical protein